MSESTHPNVVLVDLGKQKKKNAKRLAKGTGPLFDDVLETLEGLKADGVIKEGAQPVVFVVREKRKKRFWNPW